MSPDAVVAYFAKVKEQYATGQATEHSYRGALAELMQAIDPELTVINEARRIECGSPDLTIMRGEVPVGYVEAKDVGLDIRKMKGANAEQQKRYRDALPNLIYTNGLDFDFYRHTPDGASERIADVSIADYLMGVQAKPQSFDRLTDQLTNFASGDYQGQTITSSPRLAKIMADKAKLIRDAFGKALVADADNESDLAAQFLGFKETLIHDITKAQFADIYAETIVYGMFAARHRDTETPEDFSREEAMELLPASNPFLKKLFRFVAMRDLDPGVKWAVDELVAVFRATNVNKIMDRWSDAKDKRDPFLHFYENFLAEYNPAKRKSRGVWYTPEPVVNFLVRAVDDVLRDEFGIADGLASTEKVKIRRTRGQSAPAKRGKAQPVETFEEEVHRVQILDPATGTGTFLAEVIRQIEPRVKQAGSGVWSNYVEEHLIPRLHGFELLMASYAMCHMKLDMMLSELGYLPTKNAKRLSVYLTNTLEEPDEEVSDLFMARWLSDEARGANEVKREKPVMCIIGNPPYECSSQNQNDWIDGLMRSYSEGLGERRPNLNDDYMKFIRFAEELVRTREKAVVGMITSSSFLDGITQRVMRQHLLQSFDDVRILDLHGGTRSGVADEDENVFDIRVDNCIWLMIKGNQSNSVARVTYQSVLGRRREKYDLLKSHSIGELDGRIFTPRAPLFRLIPLGSSEADYRENSFQISEAFPVHSSGIQTKKDRVLVQFDAEDMNDVVSTFRKLNADELCTKFNVNEKGRDWKPTTAKADLEENTGKTIAILYKPFDERFTHYTGNSRGFLGYPRHAVNQHMVRRDNLGLIFNRQAVRDEFSFVGVSTKPILHGTFYLGNRGQDYLAPLYLYPEPDDLDQTRRVNMDPDIRAAIEEAAMAFETDAARPPQAEGKERPDEVDIFDYIYGVLHCPAYRETYAEFLKIDFPRVPYPPSPKVFWDVAEKGGQLRRLHLMEPEAVGVTPYPFEGDGDNDVTITGKKSWKSSGEGVGSVFINDMQSFDEVPEIAWEFWIGGYQPAQKWLKDRKGRTLSFDDIRHYQKIVKVLVETDRIMKTIEMPLGEAA